VKEYLLSQGWCPTEWNYKKDKNKRFIYVDGKKVKTSPKLTEDSFASVEGDIPKLVARRNILKHRRSMLLNEEKGTGLLTLVRDDGRIAAEGIPQATPTGRYRHKGVVNIPSIYAPYGREIRSCFTVPTSKVMIGTDAKGLEARMEAHYCYPFTGGKEYAAELLEGDIHSKNAKVFGTDRNGAKAPKYALVYGCQPDKLSEILGCSKKKAKELWHGFWDTNTALKEFQAECLDEWKSNGGWVLGLDGRKLFIRSPHAIVNTKFQSAGSIVVKYATVLLFNEWIPQYNVDAKLIIHQHDEFQAEGNPEHVGIHCYLANKAFEEAGEYFNINVPIEGESIVGKNWSETH